MNSRELAWKIKREALKMSNAAGASHIGSAFSVADLIAVLYSDILRYDAKNPDWDGRDRLILSKGHACAALYAALAECGFFPKARLGEYYADGGALTGHVSHVDIPGAEFSTGSLGHGFSAACGMALAAKKDGKPHRVFAILGDGECDEGSVWEAALFANQFKLTNLTAIVDYNKMQSLGFCDEVMTLEPLAQKWRAFGWGVKEADGHDHNSVRGALAESAGRGPFVLIAHTVKGKGVSFMENALLWHYRAPRGGEFDAAMAELEAQKP